MGYTSKLFGYLVFFSCKIVACKMFFSIYFRENATNHQNILQESGGFGTLSEPGLLDKKYTFPTGREADHFVIRLLCEGQKTKNDWVFAQK